MSFFGLAFVSFSFARQLGGESQIASQVLPLELPFGFSVPMV